MPNWRKVAVSGSDASFSTVFATNGITGSFTGSLDNLQGTSTHIPFFSSSQVLADSTIFQVDNGPGQGFSIAINQNAVTTANPEALFVSQLSTSSFNIISGKGNLNNYTQLNIFNSNAGTSASADVVATANNGSETTNYIDMGINNENFIGPIGIGNDAYLYSTGRHLHVGNASNYPVVVFAGGTDTDANRKLQIDPNNQHELTGSLDISGSLIVRSGITGSLYGSASYATTSSYALTASYLQTSATASFAISASYAVSSSNAQSASYLMNGATASYALTASYVANASSFPYTGSAIISGSLTITGSFNVSGSTLQTGDNALIGNTVLSGSINISGSSRISGLTTMTGSLAVTGSIVQIGNNTLLGNTLLSGSLTISGSSLDPQYTSVDIYGNTDMTGYLRFLSQSVDIDTAVSGAYIYVSGSTNDLYFAQNNKGYANTTRLRWIEGNMYTGLLNGGIITSQSSTVYQVSSGSGIIVSLNASINDNPYPTIQYLNWGNLSQSIAPFSASYDQTFVGIQSNGTIYAQGTPFYDGQFDTLISVGVVIHQNNSTINAVETQPSVGYGLSQRDTVFINAFGPLKLSGFTLAPSGSSTGSLVVGSGTSYLNGGNYVIDPNNPSYVTDAGTSTSKIWRYYDSGSEWVYNTNNGTGYLSIDPTQYSNNGVLTAVPGTGINREWSIQRVFWFPNTTQKAIVVYYGNATYLSQVDATANIPYESFVESPNTAAAAIYLGSIVVRNDADFTDSTSFKIQAGGLFRQVGGSGGGGSVVTQTLTGLSDVAIAGPIDLQPFVYSTTTAKWINSSAISASVAGNATSATTASYAQTASYVLNAVSASHAATASSADDFNVRGTLTAQTLVVQTITSSVIYSSGSNIFGNLLSNTQIFTGSVSITGSLSVFNGISNLTASNATSSSYALTASYAVSASYALSSSNAVSASYSTTSSYSNDSTSASYALTASYVAGASSFPYTGTAVITGSLVVTSTIVLDGTLSDYYTVASSTVGANNLFTQATGSYTSAYFKYTVSNSTNARTGEVMAVWNGTTTNYTDISTTDIGSTSAVTCSAAIVGSDVQFNITTGTSGWKLKSLATFM